MILRLYQLQISGQQQMIFELTCRSHRNRTKSGEFGISISSASFGEIGSDRGATTPELGGQPVQFFAWEAGGELIDHQRQLVRLLPYLQLAESFTAYPPWIPSALCPMILLSAQESGKEDR